MEWHGCFDKCWGHPNRASRLNPVREFSHVVISQYRRYVKTMRPIVATSFFVVLSLKHLIPKKVHNRTPDVALINIGFLPLKQIKLFLVGAMKLGANAGWNFATAHCLFSSILKGEDSMPMNSRSTPLKLLRHSEFRVALHSWFGQMCLRGMPQSNGIQNCLSISRCLSATLIGSLFLERPLVSVTKSTANDS